MNHKHIMVVLEDYAYSGGLDIQDCINDLEDYVKCVEQGDLNAHHANCLLNKEAKS